MSFFGSLRRSVIQLFSYSVVRLFGSANRTASSHRDRSCHRTEEL